MLVSCTQSGVPHSIVSYTSPSQLYQSVDINRSHYAYCSGSKYRKYRKKDITSGYVLVFLSLLTQHILHGFFLWFLISRIPTYFIYALKLQLLQACHIIRINELITNSLNFYIATYFSAFVSFIFLLFFLFAFVMMHNCIIIFREINFSCKIIICLTCWFHLEWVAVDK